MTTTVADLAHMIDHSLLHPTMTDADLQAGCDLARKYNVASVCVKPYAVGDAARLLNGSAVKVGSVIGFPHGNSTVAIKVAETIQACRDGAVEIDMVINIGKALSGDWEYIRQEIQAINSAAVANGAILKVIFENDFLNQATIEKLCGICSAIAVAFVKTSTGYGFVKQANGMYSYKGATPEHLQLMRRATDPRIAVKAAGGVRTLQDLLLVRSLGVTRVGATATAAILDAAQAVIDRGDSLDALALNQRSSVGAY